MSYSHPQTNKEMFAGGGSWYLNIFKIYSNILIHSSRFPTFLYIYIFGFGVAIQVNASTIISLWPRQPFGGILFMLFSGCAGESPFEPSYHQKRHYFTAKIPCYPRKIICARKNTGEKLQCQPGWNSLNIIEHPCRNPSLINIGSILFWSFLEVQPGENFIWSGDAQVCSQRYGQGNWSQHQQRSHDRTGTSHAASQKATLEIRDGGWCKKWLRLRHQEPQNGFGIWTLQDFDGFFPNSPAFSHNFPTKKWP